MRALLEPSLPASPLKRTYLALAAASVSTIAAHVLIRGYNAHFHQGAFVAAHLVAAVCVPLTYYLAVSVARCAEDAPEPDWWGRREQDSRSATDETEPVDVLKRRYAEGELTTEEFEERIDQLVGRDVVSREEGEQTLDRDRELDHA